MISLLISGIRLKSFWILRIQRCTLRQLCLQDRSYYRREYTRSSIHLDFHFFHREGVWAQKIHRGFFIWASLSLPLNFMHNTFIFAGFRVLRNLHTWHRGKTGELGFCQLTNSGILLIETRNNTEQTHTFSYCRGQHCVFHLTLVQTTFFSQQKTYHSMTTLILATKRALSVGVLRCTF